MLNSKIVTTYIIRSSHVHLFMFLTLAKWLFIFSSMDFTAKVHFCYFDPTYLVSCKEKKEVNLRMEVTILELLSDVEGKLPYLHKH